MAERERVAPAACSVCLGSGTEAHGYPGADGPWDVPTCRRCRGSGREPASERAELARALTAEAWAAECHGRYGARVLAVDAEGFTWDAEGLFAPQRMSWERAERDLARARRPRDLDGDYGGAYDGVGAVYSDADPGL